MNGHVLAQRARESLPDLPVIFMSGLAEATGAANASKLDAYISKPYKLETICSAARRLTGLPRLNPAG